MSYYKTEMLHKQLFQEVVAIRMLHTREDLFKTSVSNANVFLRSRHTAAWRVCVLLALVMRSSEKKLLHRNISQERDRRQPMNFTPLVLCLLLSHAVVSCLSENFHSRIYFKRIGFIVYLK